MNDHAGILRRLLRIAPQVFPAISAQTDWHALLRDARAALETPRKGSERCQD